MKAPCTKAEGSNARYSAPRFSLFARRVALPLLLAALGACMVGPDYEAPDTVLPDAWHAGLDGGLSVAQGDPAQLAEWWGTLHDPLLSQLIGQALAGNLDRRQAEARVLEARARRGVAGADLFPTLTADGSGRRSHASEQEGGGFTSNLYSAGFDASWELDIFGGKRRALQAADATLEASQEDLRDVLVSLLAETALNYVELRSLQMRLAIAQSNLATQVETHAIAGWRLEAGLVNQLDVDQARLNLEQTRAQIPSLKTALEQSRNRLAVLLGLRPGELGAQLDAPAAVPVPPAGVAVGVPADLLRRRPDVRRAERQLAAQTAQVGVATAARYPAFSLLGSIGLESLSLSKLGSTGADRYSFAGDVSATVFDAGRLRYNLQVQNALQEQALLGYEQAVLGALREVEDALVAYAQEQQRRASLQAATVAAQSAAALAADQYASGTIDFVQVLVAQRSLLSLQDQQASSEAEVSADLIRLYKALGGGWDPQAGKASTLGSTSGNTP